MSPLRATTLRSRRGQPSGRVSAAGHSASQASKELPCRSTATLRERQRRATSRSRRSARPPSSWRTEPPHRSGRRLRTPSPFSRSQSTTPPSTPTKTPSTFARLTQLKGLASHRFSPAPSAPSRPGRAASTSRRSPRQWRAPTPTNGSRPCTPS
ncbi:hypothetical protein DMC30DRAFT_407353 [Rhodotorula diobovata]|uniref:Uncharacterized protein n=1 Tax=Rhodotorula diobovata TaxID=5288 RepID=A0A5C5FL86_9BASI|nr:hypothetical protein DMC30DRAFT_407353 [Rhodotorula diobovata]